MTELRTGINKISKRILPRRIMQGSMVSLLALTVCVQAAQASQADGRLHKIEIKSQRTDTALLALGEKAKIQIMFSPAAAKLTKSPAISGNLSVTEALDTLLKKTDLEYKIVSENLVVVKKKGEITVPSKGRKRSSRQDSSAPKPAATNSNSDDKERQISGAAFEGLAEVEEVVVTGSRIRRSTFNSPTPISVLDLGDIDASGAGDLSELLLEIPSVSTDISTSGSQLSTQNAGLSSVNLRHLGANRTLILIDGRRTVSNSGNANRVSLGTIPKQFVQRVEVITGGASAIYGSDAIAGVVNIITKSGFEGAQIEARAGTSFAGGAEDFEVHGTYGSKFAGDRGSFILSATFDKEYGLKATDRRRALIQADFDYQNGINEFDTVTGDEPASGLTEADYADLSNDIPGGRFEINDFFYTDAGLQEGFVLNQDGFDFRRDSTLKIPRERFLAAGKLDYKLSDNTDFFSQIQYAKIDTVSTRVARGFDYNDDSILIDPITGLGSILEVGRIPLSNPFVPQVVADESSSRGVRFDRRFVEVGLRTNVNERETIRFWTGLRGATSGGWDWEISYGYGQFKQNQERRNELNIVNLIEGLNAETLASGEIQCVSADARAAGCVPVNLFGVGSITAEAADYIRANVELDTTVKQHSALAYIAGDLIDLPAGPVGIALGIEYRKDQQRVVTDEFSSLGGVTAAPIPSFSGSYDVVEGFIETNIPLVTNTPGFQDLSLDASLRVASYSQPNVSSVVSYRLGLNWRPNDDFRLRGQLARAQRAPDLTELFSPPRGDFDRVTDICDNIDAASTGTVADNCRSEVGIAAAILAEGEFEQQGSSVFSPNAGNSEISEETADTITLGAVFTPTGIPGFSLAVDYYRIKVKDVISPFSNADILRLCYEDENTFGSGNFFCNQITRDTDEGQISQIVQRVFNLNELRSEGVDVSARFAFELENIGGEFDIRVQYSRLINLERRFTGLDGNLEIERLDGELTSGSPQNEARATFGWKNSEWRLRWTTNYFGSLVDSHERLANFADELAGNPDAETPLFLNIGDRFRHDFYIAYTPDSLGSDVRLYAGIRNVFNNVGPFLPSGDTDAGRSSNFNRFYDTAGRFGYVGVRFDF
ncbi:MAG: TonB-dependent receptor [Kordiimonadaceae bacterium]|nr:TonB-dependent receptor [Kordiimonadaceae bacterium]